MRFKIPRFYPKENEAKYFRPHYRFRFVSICPHQYVFFRKRILFDVFSPILHANTLKNADGSDNIYDAFFRRRLQKPQISPIH